MNGNGNSEERNVVYENDIDAVHENVRTGPADPSILICKGKDKRRNLIDEADQKKENHDKATSSSEVCEGPGPPSTKKQWKR
ncbi:hypothetical protein H5410_014625 [Solanum commersonii]|uniref:Uncharacterized protein n=1 Tax=Solanum commersonii TaxID=4109 RepID=A0A9J5ZRG1_SOLCO|nr:hypothetical protein H5410_014625 [Solanum commersonii]